MYDTSRSSSTMPITKKNPTEDWPKQKLMPQSGRTLKKSRSSYSELVNLWTAKILYEQLYWQGSELSEVSFGWTQQRYYQWTDLLIFFSINSLIAWLAKCQKGGIHDAIFSKNPTSLTLIINIKQWKFSRIDWLLVNVHL